MDIPRHLEKAEDAVRRRNFDFAISLYQQLLAIRPDEEKARRGLREAIWRRAEVRPTPKWLAVLVGAVPRALARLYRTLKQPAREAIYLEKALVPDPGNAALNHRLGAALETAGSLASASAVYESVLERDPGDAEAARRAGSLRRKRGDVGKALEFYEKAIAADPRDPEAIKARKDLAAETALRAGRFETAASSRELVTDREAMREAERGHRVLRAAEEIEDEATRLREARARDPKDPRAAERLGRLLRHKGDLDGAVAAFEEAAALAPDSYETRVALGEARLARFDRDLEAARKAAGRGEAGAEASLRALESERRSFEIAEVEARLAIHPTDAALRARRARLLEGAGRVEEAIAEFQRAVADPRHRVEALLGLGRLFDRKGLLDLARKQLEKALEETGGGDARGKEILYALGALCEKAGAREDARAYFGRIYETDITFRDVAEKMEGLKT